MMVGSLLILLALSAQNQVLGGNTTYVFRVSKSFKTIIMTAQEKEWGASLIKRYGAPSATFLLTDLPVYVDGHLVRSAVYRNVERDGQFLVMDSQWKHVVVDFRLKQVGTSGTGGISFHCHRGGRVVICLNYTLRDAIGVPVGNPKTESPAPVFAGDEVSWVW